MTDRTRQQLLATEFSAADDSTGFMLWQVTNSWQAAQRAALKPFDLTHVQFVLLASLTWMRSDQPLMQRDLAEHAGTDPMMTSQVLRALEGKGLVERLPHPSDSRARTLRITDRGVDLTNRANAVVERVDHEFFDALGADRRAFTSMLKLVQANRSRTFQELE